MINLWIFQIFLLQWRYKIFLSNKQCWSIINSFCDKSNESFKSDTMRRIYYNIKEWFVLQMSKRTCYSYSNTHVFDKQTWQVLFNVYWFSSLFRFYVLPIVSIFTLKTNYTNKIWPNSFNCMIFSMFFYDKYIDFGPTASKKRKKITKSLVLNRCETIEINYYNTVLTIPTNTASFQLKFVSLCLFFLFLYLRFHFNYYFWEWISFGLFHTKLCAHC